MITEVQHDVVVVRWRRRRRHERWQSGIKVRLARVTGGVSVVGVEVEVLVAAVGVVPLVQRSGLSRNEDRAGTEPLFQSCPE